MKDLAIIVQGQSSYLEILKKSLTGLNVIYSTWVGEENKYSNNDIVIFNEKPKHPGPCNFNFQITSTIAGLKKAKELGFKKSLKLRSDIVPTNAHEFIKLLNNDKLNFLCWHCHEVYPKCPGYLVDYLMSGDIDDLIELFDIQDTSWCSVPEIHLTHQYITKLIKKTEIEYFLPKLNRDNDLIWLKRNIELSSYRNIGSYDYYKKYDFSLDKNHITDEYIKFLK